jgi:hypothetical protein
VPDPTNSKELSTTKEATSCAAIRYFPSILWNLKAHCYIHTSPPLDPMLSQTSPVSTLSPWSILILSTHLCLRLPCPLFPYGFSTNNLYIFLASLIHATYPAQLILFNFVILIVLGKLYKSWNFLIQISPPSYHVIPLVLNLIYLYFLFYVWFSYLCFK